MLHCSNYNRGYWNGRTILVRASLGDHELELLRYIAHAGPVSVGQALDGFGATRGLARSTINTTIERLFKKAYLTRAADGDVYRYSAAVPPDEVMDGLVEQFVEKTLAGSLTPFVSYFSRKNRLSPEEQAELERFVAKMESQKEAK